MMELALGINSSPETFYDYDGQMVQIGSRWIYINSNPNLLTGKYLASG